MVFLVYLKPLLVFLDLKQIRVLFSMVILLLLVFLGICCYATIRNVCAVYVCALCASFGTFSLVEVASVLPIFPSIAISLIGAIWILRVKEIGYRSIMNSFFFIGALTVYFDYLDNPLLTLGIPLLTLFCRLFSSHILPSKQDRILSGKRRLIGFFIVACICWLVGYGYLWVMKWVLATLVTGTDVIASAAQQANTYTGQGEFASTNSHPILGSCHANILAAGFRFKLIVILGICFLFISIMLCLCSIVLRSRYRIVQPAAFSEALILIALIGVVSLLPYAWYAILCGHSLIHSDIISFRNQALTVMGLILGIAFTSILAKDCFTSLRCAISDDKKSAGVS